MKKSVEGVTARRLLHYGLQGAVLALLVTFGVLAFTMAPETLQGLRDMHVRYVLPMVALVLGAWGCLACRIWIAARALKHPFPYRGALRIAISTEFGVAASPAGVGGTAIRLALLRSAGVPLGIGTTMVGADVLLDVLFFILVTPFALWVLLADPSWSGLLHTLFTSARCLPLLLIVAPVFIALALLVRRGSWFRDAQWLARKAPGSIRYRLPARVRLARSRVRSGVHQATGSAAYLYRQEWPALIGMFGLACLQWCCRYGVLPLLLLSLSTHRNPFPLLVLQGILFGISFLLVVPGGGGVIEMLSVMVLPLFVPRALIGMALLIWRFFTYYVHLLIGGAVFLNTIHNLGRLRNGPASSP